MKRRNFVKNLGVGLSSGIVLKDNLNSKNTYKYPDRINDVDDLKNEEGLVALRFEVSGETIASQNGDLKIKGARLQKAKTYYFEASDSWNEKKERWSVEVGPANRDIMVLWLDEARDSTSIRIKLDKKNVTFELADLIKQQELIYNSGSAELKINYLLYHEIGKINLLDAGIRPPSRDFDFVIIADPQGGDPTDETNDSTTRLKIHNAFIEESIRTANELNPRPNFALVLGDFTDSQGQASNFQVMTDYFSKLNLPLLLEIGNHETRYRSDFTPGYNMEAFSNYFAAQKEINNLEKLLYSFDAGSWHFIVWPDPLRRNFWEEHPHYFDWLEQDLEKHQDRPVIFFQHVPSQPIGIDPLVNYVESPTVKKMLLDILSRHGNVKYIFSGHVHIPVKASLKTAVTHNGMKMINLPAAGYRPRGFGEEDFFGGPTQGIALVKIRDTKAEVLYKTVTGQIMNYPESLPEFDAQKYALWLNEKWEIAANEQIVNGDFSDELTGWIPRFVYQEDNLSSNRQEIVDNQEVGPCLMLYTEKRPYDVPGQDRVPQTLNQLTQAVTIKNSQLPVLAVKYMLHEAYFDPESLNGCYLWVEGYNGSNNLLNLIYSMGKVPYSVAGALGGSSSAKPIHYDLTATSGKWIDAYLDLNNDFSRASEEELDIKKMGFDRILVTIGTWTVNDGHHQKTAAYFTGLQVLERKAVDTSQLTNANSKAEEDIWGYRIKHIAGEHQYGEPENLYPDFYS